MPNIQKNWIIFNDLATIFTESVKIHQKYIHVFLHTDELSIMVFLSIYKIVDRQTHQTPFRKGKKAKLFPVTYPSHVRANGNLKGSQGNSTDAGN